MKITQKFDPHFGKEYIRKIENNMKLKLFIISIFISLIFGQNQQSDNRLKSYADYQLSSERYITNSEGRIFMKVNIWGHVGSPGSHLVNEGIDFASLLSLVGGPQEGANLKKVTVYRENIDEKGKLVYNVDLEEFIKTGDRSNFIKIYPNDTIIIPQKLFNQFLNRINTVNLLFSLVTLSLQISTIISG